MPPLPGGEVSRVPLNTEPLPAPASTPNDEDELVEPQGRKAAISAALRDSMVDAFDRVIRSQCDRARKAQTSPQKLGQFADTSFGDTEHVRTCVEKVRPSVRAWLTFIGSEASPHEVSDAVLRMRFSSAKADLQKVAAITYDSEFYQQSMLQLMTRWETKDAAHLVDQVIQRGINKNGTLVLEPPPLPVRTSNRPDTRSVAFLEKWSRQQRCSEELAREKEQASRSPLALREKKLEALRAR
jgi:hypothetical protein